MTYSSQPKSQMKCSEKYWPKVLGGRGRETMVKFTKKSLLAAASVASLITSATNAMGQTRSGDRSVTGVEEIVVTAQKRSENLQDVPASITALNEKALDLRQIGSL